MKKVKVTGPTNYKILDVFKTSIIIELGLPKVEFTSISDPNMKFEVIVDSIDASVWNLSKSTFENEPRLKKVLVIKGWINKQESKKAVDTVARSCKIEIYDNGDIFLQKKRVR